jgi:hypothetical protein
MLPAADFRADTLSAPQISPTPREKMPDSGPEKKGRSDDLPS